jgi:hypothetical protein
MKTNIEYYNRQLKFKLNELETYINTPYYSVEIARIYIKNISILFNQFKNEFLLIDINNQKYYSKVENFYGLFIYLDWKRLFE